jgi:DNA-binding winged helix-turn-helix (wHTH) protein
MGIHFAKTENAYDRLLSEFLAADCDHFLSKEDIRQDVLFDEEASEGSIRQLVCETRKRLAQENSQWTIETICRKGYRLVKLKVLHETGD